MQSTCEILPVKYFLLPEKNVEKRNKLLVKHGFQTKNKTLVWNEGEEGAEHGSLRTAMCMYIFCGVALSPLEVIGSNHFVIRNCSRSHYTPYYSTVIIKIL